MFLAQIVFVQIVIFSMVLFFLRKIMLGSTESAVNRLNESYSEVNKKKEQLAEKLKQTEEEYQRRKKEAENIARKMQEEAEKEITEKRDSMLKKAHAEAEQIVVDAVSAKDSMREEIKKEEQIKVVDFCQDIICNIFTDSIDAIDKVLSDSFLNEFKGMDSSKFPSGIKEIEVITRNGCSDAHKAIILERVSVLGGHKLSIKETEDKTIVAGLVLKFGSLVLDGSLQAKIKDASTALKDKIEKDLYNK
jgi:F0F1-type ATP synthase membrane subunit b/b'